MKISVRVDFDSIAECLKLVGKPVEDIISFEDTAFLNVADRLLSLADKYNIKLSFYFIGRDLENEKNCEVIRKIHALGHEIGNHSYNHFQNLSEHDYSFVYNEILKTHEIIQNKIKVIPKGFIAPAWSYSSKIIKALIDLNYEYDSSLAPSFLMPIANFKLKLKSKESGLNKIPWIRTDFFAALFGERKPFYATEKMFWKKSIHDFEKGVIQLPLPTTKFRFPIWHTLNFVIEDRKWAKLIHKSIQQSNNSFYYVIHPADLICPEKDLNNLPEEIKSIERIMVPLSTKMEKLDKVFAILSKQNVVHMRELAKSSLA